MRGSAHVRAAALGGIVAPVLFGVAVTSLTLADYDFLTNLGWDPVRRTHVGWPSVLALGEHGWLLTATFAGSGLLGLAFAAALASAVRRTVWSALGIALLAVFAATVALESFTTDPPGSLARPTWHGEIHDRAYPLLVVSAVAAPVFLGVAFARDPRWRAAAPFTLAAAVILLVALVLQVERGLAQLLEYPFFATLLVWLELVALRLLRLAGPGRRTRAARRDAVVAKH